MLIGAILWIFAVATGAIVANMYYCQPILPRVASTFHHTVASVTFVVTATQIGYAIGLALIVPLGDLMARKRLVPSVFMVAAVGCALCAIAPSFTLFLVASAIVGSASVGGQILIPFVADFAPIERRSRSVARLMSGLLTGVLLARTFSGIIAQAYGWRTVYFASMGIMVVLSIALYFLIPAEPQREHERYRQLLLATVKLLRDEPILRQRSLLGGLVFGCFSVLWSALSWQLSRSPFRLDSFTIGLFGIIGLSGVTAASFVGRIADKHEGTSLPFKVALCAGVATVVSFVLFIAGANSLIVIIFGVVLLDAGTQGIQLSNQTLIYGLHSASRSRITSAYMFVYFLGGVVGSALAGVALEHSGWAASSLVGLVMGAGVLGISISELLRNKRLITAHAAA
jgi:predicted MFS family arabinose efflux permease